MRRGPRHFAPARAAKKGVTGTVPRLRRYSAKASDASALPT